MTGAVVGVIGFAWIASHGKAELVRAFGLETLSDGTLAAMLAALICFFVAMCCTTFCSLSIEGRRHWIWATSPIGERILYGSKVFLNLCLTVPLSLFCAICGMVALHPSAGGILLLLLAPLLYSVASALWGMFIETRFADYSVENENQIMNQSLSYFLGKLPFLALPVVALALLVV